MKGRPVGSIVRERICSILNIIQTGYGYEIYKLYKEAFGNLHIRTIYYNLKKGIEKEEIILLRVEKEIGDYSWGDEVQKIYYALGPYANSHANEKDLVAIKNVSEKYIRKIEVNWNEEIKNLAEGLIKEMDDYKERYDVLSNQGKKLIKEKLANKYSKLKEFSSGKMEKENFNELMKEINSHTP